MRPRGLHGTTCRLNAFGGTIYHFVTQVQLSQEHPICFLPSRSHFGWDFKRDAVTDGFTIACRLSSIVFATLTHESCLPISTNGNQCQSPRPVSRRPKAPAVISHSRLHLSSPSDQNAWFATVLPGVVCVLYYSIALVTPLWTVLNECSSWSSPFPTQFSDCLNALLLVTLDHDS